jgi:hypothetical protein
MKSRLARGAVLAALLLFAAFVVYRVVVYSSPEEKKARWQKTVEQELQVVEYVADSLNIGKNCIDSIAKLYSLESRKGISKVFSDVDTSGLTLREKLKIIHDKQKSDEIFNPVKYCDSLYGDYGGRRYYVLKRDSLILYRKLKYDCGKIVLYFESTRRPERIPLVCR